MAAGVLVAQLRAWHLGREERRRNKKGNKVATKEVWDWEMFSFQFDC